jgi:hypothetical protein
MEFYLYLVFMLDNKNIMARRRKYAPENENAHVRNKDS